MRWIAFSDFTASTADRSRAIDAGASPLLTVADCYGSNYIAASALLQPVLTQRHLRIYLCFQV
jgi:hypothetical protein